MSWKTALMREVKGLSDDIIHRIAKQFEGSAETTDNVAKAARMAKRLQARKAAAPPTKPLARAPRAQMPAAAPKATMPKAKPSLAVKKPLALPKPGPGLPPGASKPRGGQFHPNGDLSPEMAARNAASYVAMDEDWIPMPEGDVRTYSGEGGPLSSWMEKALAKYYKRDFGAPEDPLRDLAVRGLHYDPDMTPEKWKATVDSFLYEDPIGYYTVPEYNASKTRTRESAELLAAAPWLAKQPVTDNLYGIAGGGLNLDHFTDEMMNALRPEVSGLPNDLAVDVTSLQRMSFPQAVERVGRVNQWRAKQMEEAAASRLNSPAVQMFKEYPDDPSGMRWVELRQPEFGTLDPPEDWGWTPEENGYRTPAGAFMERDPGRNGGFTGEEGYWHHPETQGGTVNPDKTYEQLQEQLKFEGDAMGHCVGGYCDDVAAGRSRIFSLRDGKGNPHVTVETEPHRRVFSDIRAAVGEDTANAWLDEGAPLGEMVTRAQMPDMQNIVQIKGKQNRAPNPEYLPFVQDFVKSGQWGQIGDLGNTGLTQLPDKRFVTQEQIDEALGNRFGEVDDTKRHYFQQYGNNTGPMGEWDDYAAYFEGYKRGGRVKAKMPVDLKVNAPCACGGLS